MATVQAMVILSNHEIGNGKDARGWLYSGASHFHCPNMRLIVTGYARNGDTTLLRSRLAS